MSIRIKIVAYSMVAFISNFVIIILVQSNFANAQKHIEADSVFLFMLLSVTVLFFSLLRIILILRSRAKVSVSLSLIILLVIFSLYWTMTIFDSAKCVACDGGKKANTLFWIHE